ncbi:purple acid phosphatase family protein [Adhaeretor mobilis]|uniref:Alkaline phosphatase n=1 Tax=Adhaeretor mobilis TaxID=1930276 RepID=A0A517MPW9_9BACT|nr:metallophosphoesterase family protein [Adhaeretor mobilis]QDS96935.1 Alkaline phosphatase precursor [Adhaeretor mobilis]
MTFNKLLRFSIALLLSLIGNQAVIVAHDSEAHDGDSKPASFSQVEQYRPTPLPDRVVLTWSDQPTNSIDITWRTDQSVGKPVVEYTCADDLLGDLRSEIPGLGRVTGVTQDFQSDLGACLMHSAQLRGLSPETMYAYRVGDGEHFSEWFQFRTASRSNDPFTFVYFGDAQNEVRSWWSRVVREANQHAPRAAFMLHAGDLVNRANQDADWGEWFGAGGWLNGMIPVIACPGNHEYQNGLSRHWRPQFAFPKNGPPGLEETAYWIDYQGARIISLNSNEKIEQQKSWLEAVLKDPQRPKWTFVTFHHPIFSAAKDRDNPTLRDAWREILEHNHVDLVLQGHDHAYARSGLGGPINLPEGIRKTKSNTVYVVSVSGPKMYSLQETWEVSRVASGGQLFQVIHVQPNQLRYEARLATGELYDAFKLKKDANGNNVLTEQFPHVDEIRR